MTAVFLGLLCAAYWLRNGIGFALLLAALSVPLVGLAMTVGERARGLSVSLVSVLLSLAVIDVGLGLTAAKPIEHEIGDGGRFFLPDTELGVRLDEGRHRWRLVERESGAEIYDRTYTIGADGFRVTPPARPALNGTDPRTAWFLGGSFTFGEGVADDETLPALFQALAPGYLARNLGVPALGPHQSLRFLEIAEARPVDVMVLQTAPWHIYRITCLQPYSVFGPRYGLDEAAGGLTLAGRCSDPLPEFAMRILRKSPLFMLARRRILESLTTPEEDLALYVEIIKAMRSLAREKFQARFAVAFLKSPEDLMQPLGLSNSQVHDAIEAAGLPIVDVTLAARAEDIPAVFEIRLDGHPTGAGHRLRAEKIAEFIGVGR